MQSICADLEAEHADLDQLVSHLSDEQWELATPADGWAVRDQISHLWYFDQQALLALTDADAFAQAAEQLLASGDTSASVEPGRSLASRDLLTAWRDGRRQLVAFARTVDPATRVPWYGPAMAAKSFITARLMESWAHGQDIADAIDVQRVPTSRLKHVAHIGVRARPFAYMINGLELPPTDVLVELTAPDGSLWQWGESGSDSVRGPAVDFCLLVTQRRHLLDTELQVEGERAKQWVGIAQAFAGPPGGGRPPRAS